MLKSAMKKVYIIEDEMLLRDLLIEAVKLDDSLESVGCACDGKEGLDECLRISPDLVVLDVTLPSLSGVEIARQIKNRNPEIKILFFSGLLTPDLAKVIEELKVEGMVEKSSGYFELGAAIKKVAYGETCFSPGILKTLEEMSSN